MSEIEYSNGADGSCQQCGEPTDEEWHAFCSSCFAAQNGWRRPERDALEAQHEDRERVTIGRLLERLERAEARIARLERQRAA